MSVMDELNVDIQTAKDYVAKKNSLIELYNNKHFKAIVEEGYFKDEAARLVMAKGNTGLNAEQQNAITNMMYGVGALASYLDGIHRRGNEMEATLKDHELEVERISEEEIN